MMKFLRAKSIFLFMIVIIFPFHALAETKNKTAEKKYLNIQEVTSQGGIKAWLVEDHTIPVIAMQFSFRDNGAKSDPADKSGLAQLASNMFDEGAGEIKSEEFQKTLQDLSIDLRFQSDRDHFSGNLKTLSKNQDKAFELLSLALTKPRFDADALERMRASNISRIKSSMTEPDWIAARIQNDRIFEGHPYARNSGGTLSSLGAITPDDLRAFQKTLGKNRLVVAVSGDITPAALSDALDRIFGGLPEVPAPENTQINIQNNGKVFVFQKDIPQTIIEITQSGISRKDEDYHTAQIMNYILGGSGFGSRLMEEIREKRGLTYGIYSFFREYESAKVMHVSTSTKNENVKDMLALITAEWKKMAETPVSEKELADAKSYMIGSLPLTLTSNDSIANLLLSLQIDNLPIDYLDTRNAKIKGITAQDILASAKKRLDPASFVTVLVGKPAKIENSVNIESLPNVE